MTSLTGITKGTPKKVEISFKSNEIPRDPVDWELLDWNGDRLDGGVATSEGNNRWSAVFTVSKSLNIPGGAANVEVEFDTIMTDGKYKSKSREFTVVDLADDWKSYGLLYYPKGDMPQTIKDTILVGSKASKITIEIRDGFGAGDIKAMRVLAAPVETSSSDIGWSYNIELPAVVLPYASGGFFPHQMIVTTEFEDGSAPDVTVRPIYTLTPLTLSHLTNMKRYLDKARLIEIDPNLTWQDEELVHFLLTGALAINGFDQVSYWTIDTMPSTLYVFLQKAAEWEALNARFLAEGMVEFDWQGANTQLNVNRKEAIQVKMDEINQYLEQRLGSAKKAALSVFGPGTPPEGVVAGKRALGGLHITGGPTNNYITPYRRGWGVGGYRY